MPNDARGLIERLANELDQWDSFRLDRKATTPTLVREAAYWLAAQESGKAPYDEASYLAGGAGAYQRICEILEEALQGIKPSGVCDLRLQDIRERVTALSAQPPEPPVAISADQWSLIEDQLQLRSSCTNDNEELDSIIAVLALIGPTGSEAVRRGVALNRKG